MLKILTSILIIISLFAIACTKDHTDPEPQPDLPPPVAKDTLAPGWRRVTYPDNMCGDIFFIGRIGYTISLRKIYQSADGGDTWVQKYRAGSGLTNIAMGNDSNAVFTTMNTGMILMTHNGGQSFDSLVLADPDKIDDAFFVSAKIAYAIGRYFWKTNDAGYTWNKVYEFAGTNFNESYKSLHFLTGTLGWMSVTRLGMFKTENGGANWEIQKPPGNLDSVNRGLASVFFTDVSHGYLAYLNQVAVTDNSGQDWSVVLPLQYNYHDLFFLNQQTGYLTDKQYIYKTTNGGVTWSKEVVIPGESFVELHFADADRGWACGYNGTILKYEK